MRERLKTGSRREIPAVNKVLDALDDDLATASKLPRPLVVDLVRQELSRIRSNKEIPKFESTVEHLHQSLDLLRASRLQPVINGTGIVIHTNFGRAPLAPEAIRVLAEIGSGYSNLEYDLATGGRGHRGTYVENALALLCGGEAATVVNNCAAALVLIVQHFTANGRARPQLARRVGGNPPKDEIIISRGELVQIGGGFRIGEIIEATGANLREVGATNKTTLDDYRRAIGFRSAMILKVHRSNFFMSGFVESPSAAAIAALARKKRIPFVEDLGSGAVVPTEQFGIREPLFRALRCDKLSFAALQTTIDLHLNHAAAKIPAIGLLQVTEDELRNRAVSIKNGLSDLPLQITIGRSTARIGGGTLPKSAMTSVTIEIVPTHCSPADLAARLRNTAPPVVGYVANDRFKLDLRTIFPHQDESLVEAIRKACSETP